MIKKNVSVASVALMVLTGLVGCGASPNKATSSQAVKEVSEQGHSHEGWWCTEHGMPEEVCAQCSSKIAADFKAKGDWCQKHGRPDSQCFICHPEKEAEFAAQYEAKYGKQPPKSDGDESAHEKS